MLRPSPQPRRGCGGGAPRGLCGRDKRLAFEGGCAYRTQALNSPAFLLRRQIVMSGRDQKRDNEVVWDHSKRSVALFFQFGPKAPRRHPERRVRRGKWGRYGVADLRSGLRPNRGVMCKVRGSLPGPGRTTAERTTLAPRRSPRDSNQSVFLVMRSPPDASKRPQVTCLRASERIPGPRHETSILERLIQVTSS